MSQSEAKWKQIPEFPNYWVSDHGDIFNMKFLRLLKIYETDYGMMVCNFWKNGKQFSRSVDKLKRQAFGDDDTTFNS